MLKAVVLRAYPSRLIAQERDEKVHGSDSLIRFETPENRQAAKSTKFAKDLESARFGGRGELCALESGECCAGSPGDQRENKMQ